MEDRFCNLCVSWQPRRDRNSLYGTCTNPDGRPQQRTYCKDSCNSHIPLKSITPRNTLHDKDRSVYSCMYPDHTALIRAMFGEFLNARSDDQFCSPIGKDLVNDYIMAYQGQFYNCQGFPISIHEVKRVYIIRFLGQLNERYYYKIVPAASILKCIQDVSIGATTIAISHATIASDYSDSRQDRESHWDSVLHDCRYYPDLDIRIQ